MAVTITLPKLGMTMESAKISVWLKRDGERVERDDLVVTIETDKAVTDVAAPEAGIVWQRAQVGDELPVGATLAVVAKDMAEYDRLRGNTSVAATSGSAAAVVSAASGGGREAAGGSAESKVRVAPVARALASEKGVDLSLVTGTGPAGRVTKEDVLRVVEQREAADSGIVAGVPGGHTAGTPSVADKGGTGSRRIPRTERRRIVAAKMTQAVLEAAATTHSADVDATALDALRRDLLERTDGSAASRMTITDLVIKLTALALRQHPILNSTYADDADILYDDIHIGMAMSIEEGDLLVPVFRHADKLSVAEIARTRTDYLERARRRALTLDDLSGGTFTVSGLGMLGLERFVAMINRPENAILAVGAILDRPWVCEGQVAVRKVMNVTLTYDHRTIYGADAARFMATLVRALEHPAETLRQADVASATEA